MQRERDTQICRKKKIQRAHILMCQISIKLQLSSFAHIFPLFTLSMLYSKKLLSLLLGLRLQGSTSFSSAVTKRTPSAACLYQQFFVNNHNYHSSNTALFGTSSDSNSNNNMSDEVAAAKAAAAEYKSSDADGESHA